MAGEYAFVMKDLRKVVPPKREILRGIWLSFFHGAKIGVLGANGAAKLTLLRTMARVDEAYLAEAAAARGPRARELAHDAQLAPTSTLRANVDDSAPHLRSLPHL